MKLNHRIMMEQLNYYVGRRYSFNSDVTNETNILAGFQYYQDAIDFVLERRDNCNFYMIYNTDGIHIRAFAPKGN